VNGGAGRHAENQASLIVGAVIVLSAVVIIPQIGSEPEV
jgi:hypothetical protein